MKRAWIVSANALLLVACCFFAARTIASVAGGWLAPAEVATPPRATRSQPKPPAWNDRQIILSRNLFNVSTLAPAGAAVPAEESYEKTRLPLKLLGTAASANPSLSWAAVEDEKNHQHEVVRVGDRLQDQAEVVRIERRRIVLQNGPKLEELALEEDKGQAGPDLRRGPLGATFRAPTSARSAIQRLSDNRYLVNRDDVQSLSGNPAALFSQARIVPKYDKGAMVGVQVNAIRPGSLFQQLGIQNGDVITELNGKQLNGPQQSAWALRELSQSSDLAVTVQGTDGQTRQLEYEVR